MTTLTRRGGIPPALAQRPLRTFRPRDAEHLWARPRDAIARLVRQGYLLKAAPGHYTVVPQEHVGDAWWNPDIEAQAIGVAVADLGEGNAALMGVSAARIHHAIPRALAVAVIAATKQHPPVQLANTPGVVLFVKRDLDKLDLAQTRTSLGPALATTIEQTAVDLARHPDLGDAAPEARRAAQTLAERGDRHRLAELAQAQHAAVKLRRLLEEQQQ